MLFKLKNYLTDGGFETEMLFKEGFELPEFAAFPLLESELGRSKIEAYYREYLDIVVGTDIGFVIETPTWRASSRWGEKLGYDKDALKRVNRMSVELARSLKDEYSERVPEILISGNIGPQDDGYSPTQQISVPAAHEYHHEQIETFATSGVDLITALTMTYPEEAIGVVKAAAENGIPAVISFTVETDGLLPNGMSLEKAIREVDGETQNGPVHYMVNCAHPSHFDQSLSNDVCRDRVRGARGNASRMSHEELDNSPTLDEGRPLEFGVENRTVMAELDQLKVLGGCCGTDTRHIRSLAVELIRMSL